MRARKTITSRPDLTKLEAVAAKIQEMASLPTSGTNSRLVQPQQPTEAVKNTTKHNKTVQISPKPLIVAKPYREEEFELFKLWRSVPAILRIRANAEKMGIQNEMILNVMEIKNRSMFARQYGVHKQTLVEWDKKLDTEESDEWASFKNIMRKMTPTVLTSFANKTIQYGDAARVKLWMQVVEDWKEKSETNVNQSIVHFDLVGYVKEVEARNAKIRAKIIEERRLENEKVEKYLL